jgi:hypothetical protein
MICAKALFLLFSPHVRTHFSSHLVSIGFGA